MNLKPLAHLGGPQVPSRIIVHAMGEFIRYPDGSVLSAWEVLDKEGLSAHALVHPDGALTRCVPDNRVAWHARGFNQHSLGVEVLVAGEYDYASFLARIKEDWTTPEQLAETVRLCRSWRDTWGIEQVDRHSDVDPDRKKDPGEGFPWSRFIERLFYQHGTL